MARSYKTEGIVIKRINFGEADKILTVFTKHYGKINCIAKGIRRLTSRKGGNLDLFNHLTLFIAKGKNLDIIIEVQTINTFPIFKKNLHKIAIAYQFSDLINRFLGEAQENNELFNLLVLSLNELNKKYCDTPKILINYKFNLLKFTGFGLPENISEPCLNQHIEMIINKRVKYFYE